MIIQITTPPIDTTSIVTILASFCGVLMVAVGVLYNTNLKLSKEHKSDLKLFDKEHKTLNKETFDILNKFFLNFETNKITDDELKRKIDRVISLLENLKDKS